MSEPEKLSDEEEAQKESREYIRHALGFMYHHYPVEHEPILNGMTELGRLEKLPALLRKCALDHEERAREFERGGNFEGAVRLRAVSNLLWAIIQSGNYGTIL